MASSSAVEIIDDENTENFMQEERLLEKRGVKSGTKRGHYIKNTRACEAKKRVLAAAENHDNWKAVALANGIATSTAYGWIRTAQDPLKKRGGSRHRKVYPEHIEKMIGYVEENPYITLKEIRAKFALETGITVSTNTIHNYLEGQMYTVKKALPQPVTVNSEVNKRKRREYVEKIMNRTGMGKTVIYIDETNVNLFLRRSQARARKGFRPAVKCAPSRGRNIHILGGIAQYGMVYWERKRGNYRKEDCNEWLRRMLRTITEPSRDIVVVCDNAPVHVDLEKVVAEEEFSGVEIIRLGPYSPALNPIEECWSAMKATMKRDLSNTFITMMNTTPVGMSQTEYRMQYLERCIDNAILTITSELCLKTLNHVQKHFPKVIHLEDI